MKKQFRLFCICIVVVFVSSCNNEPTKNEPTKNANEPKQLSYTVIATHPHDVTSFTEGLEYRDGFLYEGTGNYGESILTKKELQTGKAIQKIELSKDFFGEGITLLNGKIYQLTYKENKCFVYDATTLVKIKEFTYEGEGWGMTNDGKQLINSNGSNTIYFRDPETFAVTKTIAVSNNYGPLGSLNELEYVDGYLFANVWTTFKIVKIDLTTGNVVAEINLDDLLPKYAPEILNMEVDKGLNGIAYDSKQQRFFITGKNYPKIFEVKFN
jgi:glutamine cyclotransferase